MDKNNVYELFFTTINDSLDFFGDETNRNNYLDYVSGACDMVHSMINYIKNEDLTHHTMNMLTEERDN